MAARAAIRRNRRIAPALMEQIEKEILQPTVDALRQSGIDYRGVLYAGLMITPQGDPTVLEFNCRFGDPETQAVLFRLESDLIDVCEAVAKGTLPAEPLRWSPEPSVCVVLASGGYPGTFTNGKPISGLDHAEKLPHVKVFHAGTAHSGNQVVTAGGRVLGVTASGPTLELAASRAYEAVEGIRGELLILRVLSSTDPVDTQGPVWYVEGRSV